MIETFDMNVVFPGDLRVDAVFEDSRAYTGREGDPSPFDLFLAGIGTCSGIKVARFCQERDIPTDKINIRQRMFYNPDTNMIEKIELDIQLPPDFPAKYVDAIIRVANSCGVRKHLITPPEFDIHTTISEPA